MNLWVLSLAVLAGALAVKSRLRRSKEKLIYLSLFEKEQKKLNPKDTIVAFDLHGVVLHADYWGMVLRLFQSPSTLLQLLVIALDLRVLAKAVALHRQSDVFQHVIAGLGKSFPKVLPHVSFLLDLQNIQSVDADVVNIIKDLKEAGCDVIVFSNIGSEPYKYVEQSHLGGVPFLGLHSSAND